MPLNHYIRLFLNGQPAEIESVEDLGLNISYHLEDGSDFQTKKTSEAYELSLPATRANDRIFNHFRNPNIQDLTPNEIHKNLMPCSIEAGIVLLTGYAQLKSSHTENGIAKYLVNCYGSNGDWSIPMRDLTIADCCNQNTHTLDIATIENSWNYDGTNENEDYVYAPVRYNKPFLDNDIRVVTIMLRPSISIYWILIRAFRKFGYEINSNFFDTPYFRRLVMPWTWGDFLNLNSSEADSLKFKAVGDGTPGHCWLKFDTQLTIAATYHWGDVHPVWGASTGSQTISIANDHTLPGFDNGNVYNWDGTGYNMFFTYPNTVNLGTITCHFTLRILVQVNAQAGSWANLRARVYKNGIWTGQEQILCQAVASTFGNATSGGVISNGNVTVWNFDATGLNPGDQVMVKLHYHYKKSMFGGVSLRVWDSFWFNGDLKLSSLEMTGITIEPGGIVDIKQYDGLKKYKVLDMLRGLIDCFDLSMVTDTFTKKVYIEPLNVYSLDDNLNNVSEGHFSANHLDWNEKRDLEKPIQTPLFSDMEKEFYMTHKADGSDGGQNKYRLQNGIEPGEVYYKFPERFKSGKKDMANRFFATSMHVFMKPMEGITGIAPQMMAILPENVANRSKNESEMAFLPRIAYFKGKVDTASYGGWNWEGTTPPVLPFMFAVNYRHEGHKDPILTYCNQRLETGGVAHLGIGLAQRFYIRRFIMFENGQQYIGYFYLNNNDIANWRHRERIILDGAEYHIFSINDYQALKDESTEVLLWKVAAVRRMYSPTGAPTTGFFPSDPNVMNPGVAFPSPDIKYKELLLLYTDLSV